LPSHAASFTVAIGQRPEPMSPTPPAPTPSDRAAPASGGCTGWIGRRRRRVRRLGHALLVLAALALAGLGGVLYGWRYGFTALPLPVAGGEPVVLAALGQATLTTNHIWYWVVELDRSRMLDRRAFVHCVVALDAWAARGQVTITNREVLERFFDANPVLAAATAAAAAASHGPEHTVAGSQGRRLTLAHNALIYRALWRASEGERLGDSGETWNNLLAAWRLQKVEGGWWPQRVAQGTLARAWRRLALDGPAVSDPHGRQLLDALERVRGTWPPLEEALASALRERAANPVFPGRLSASVPAQFGRAFSAMGRETVGSVGQWFTRLLGGVPAPASESEGWRHLIEPASAAVWTLARSVGRAEDAAQVRRAYATQVTAALRRGAEAEAVDLSDRLLARFFARPWLARLLDRPAAHAALAECPSLGPFAFERHRTEAALESCRLVLALRLYRDRHGHWPERGADLVPEFLSAEPFDPFTGRPFAYERTAAGWRVRAGVEGAGVPDAEEDGVLFTSEETAPPAEDSDDVPVSVPPARLDRGLEGGSGKPAQP
jgi:hypothetical protein